MHQDSYLCGENFRLCGNKCKFGHKINDYYRPHPKNDGRLCFHRCLSLHTCEGGYPIPGQDGGDAPFPGLDGRYPIPGLDRGVPYPRSGQGGTPSWGTPHPCLERVPPPPVRRQSSIANTCYTAGGKPLAFTQEDFLVWSVCGLVILIATGTLIYSYEKLDSLIYFGTNLSILHNAF